ncbi:PREDICTED: ryanodine receptor 1-like, partial [Sturnus vulgaris]|uniref:ryanodine receptor 1-like n=1 Tax=Sturnus vulgaris TaxID=9172 RepID=UPI00071A7BAF
GLPSRVEELCPDLPDLERLMGDIGGLADSGARYTEMPHVIEVTLPMLCHYLPRWWERGPDATPQGPWATDVTSHHLNALLGHILHIVVNNLGIDEASWMKRLAVFAQPIVSKARPELLRSHFIPTLGRLRKRAGKVVAEEEQLRLEGKAEAEDAELLIRDEFSVLCRDLYALYPLLIRYVDNSRTPAPGVPISPNPPGVSFHVPSTVPNDVPTSLTSGDAQGAGSEQERSKKRRRGDRYSVHTSLIVATLKKMLPIGLNMCSPADQELIALAKGRYALKDTDEEVREFLHNNLHLQDKVENTGSARWQMALVRQAGRDEDPDSPEQVVRRVQEVSAVLYHLEQTEHPYKSKKAVWHKLLSKQRRRAVVACFRMTPLYNLPRHRACNMFLESYRLSWLAREQPPFEDRMIDDLSVTPLSPCPPRVPPGEKVMSDDEFTQDLFRLLQLLCEGHNNDFQNYLRTQTGNTTTINIIICTVDYLLRLQESISDFYWYYSGKDVIDEQGKRNFSKAMAVPTPWNVVNGTIARQMVDMLVESSSNVTMILKFFDMFLKLRDIVSSDAFRHFVTDPRGLISKKDFQKAMDSQKQYEPDEIQFLLSCSEADENEMIDVESFAQRFQEPARDIGFNVAVLLTNLSEHVPHDQRLKTFLEQAESILDYFRPFLGRIEIMGAARRIERIYFEISGANKAQWEMPQVKESKRQFIFDVVNEGGEAEKMELFVNFCEDTIFEMQIASRISEEEAPRDDEEEEDEDREEEEPAGPEAPASALPGLGVLRRVLGSPQTWRRRMRRLRKKSGRELAWEAGLGVGRVAVGGVLGGLGVLAVLGRLAWSSLFGGGLVEGAQRLGVMEVLGSMPDPTQDAVGGGGEAGGGEDDEGRPPEGEQPPEAQLEAAAEVEGEEDEEEQEQRKEVKAAPAGPGLRKEPHFRLAAPDAPGGLGDIGEPPGAEPPTPEGTPILRRKIGEMAEQVGEVQKEEEPPAETEKADTENGEKGPEGPEGGSEPRPPPPKRRKSVPRERREPPAEGGFDFWGELEVQRVKFLNYLSRNFYNLRFLALFLAFAINFILLFYKVSEHPPGAPEEPEGSGVAPEEDGGVPGGPEAAGGVSEEPEVYYFLEESTGYMGPALRGLALAHTLVAFLCIIGYNCLKELGGAVVTTDPLPFSPLTPPRSFPSNYWDKFIKRKVLEKYGDIYGRERIAELLGMDLASLEMGAQGERRPPPDSSLLTWITSIDIRYQIWKFGVIFTDNSFLYLTWYMAMSLLGHYNNFFFASHLLDIAMGVKTLRTILSSVTHNGKQVWGEPCLIIDAFGELRDQQEQVKEDMETKCFICGIGSDYFDTTPHGFETHTLEEHNLANYMFFLMYLINKDETEHTGQESYVWKMYQERCWDFFPAGDCFRKQYEDQLG